MGTLNAPGRKVKLADGERTVVFTTRKLIALEEAYGSWDAVNEAWDAKSVTVTANVLSVALSVPEDEAVNLLEGIRVRTVKAALIGAINDAIGGAKDPGEAADPTTAASPTPGTTS